MSSPATSCRVLAAPDLNRYVFDDLTGYYIDPMTGLYYDAGTQVTPPLPRGYFSTISCFVSLTQSPQICFRQFLCI